MHDYTQMNLCFSSITFGLKNTLFVFYANWVVFQTQSFYSGFVLGSCYLLNLNDHFLFFFHSHLIFVICYFVYFMFPLQIIIFHLCVSKGKIPEDAVHWAVCLACNDVMSSFSFHFILFVRFLSRLKRVPFFFHVFRVLFNGKSGAFIAWHVHTRSLTLFTSL